MKSLVIKLGRLHLRVTRKQLIVFAGHSKGREQDLHFSQFFKPLKGWLRPHLTLGKTGSRFYLDRFRVARLVDALKGFERELTDQFLKVAKRVEPDALQAEHWFFLCPEATRHEWTSRLHPQKESGDILITEETFQNLDGFFEEALRPAELLHQMQSISRPHALSAFRLTGDEGLSEHSFLYYFPEGLNHDAPGWYRVPGSFFAEQCEAMLFQRVPPKVWGMLLTINDRLGLEGDREKLSRLARR